MLRTSTESTTNQEQPQIKTISSSSNEDHVDALNQLIEDLKSGKIDESEFNKNQIFSTKNWEPQ